MKLTIKNEEMSQLNGCDYPEFPKYTSQLMNLANQNAQGTRPHVVGQLSEMFPEYQDSSDSITIDDWRQWYLQRCPDAMEVATDKIYSKVEKFKEAILLIDKNLVRQWVEDLVITKTYNGMYVQKAILAKIAEKKGCSYRLSRPEEESRGIDGFVGDTAYSVKPETYKLMHGLSETFDAKMVFYSKKKTGFVFEIED